MNKDNNNSLNPVFLLNINPRHSVTKSIKYCIGFKLEMNAGILSIKNSEARAKIAKGIILMTLQRANGTSPIENNNGSSNTTNKIIANKPNIRSKRIAKVVFFIVYPFCFR